jgi:hypothetical protein
LEEKHSRKSNIAGRENRYESWKRNIAGIEKERRVGRET